MMSFLPMMNESPVIAISPFWAEAIQKSTLSVRRSRGIMPSEDVVSVIIIAPLSWASRPISLIGLRIGSGFVVRYVDYGNVCILFDGASVKLHIDGFVYRHLKVYVRQMVISAHFSRAGGICAVVENQSLFPFRKQGIQVYVNVDCSRAAESTEVYLSTSACATLRRSRLIPAIRSANSRSRGQMSGTTCAIFTVSVVVAGPGLRICFVLSV